MAKNEHLLSADPVAGTGAYEGGYNSTYNLLTKLLTTLGDDPVEMLREFLRKSGFQIDDLNDEFLYRIAVMLSNLEKGEATLEGDNISLTVTDDEGQRLQITYLLNGSLEGNNVKISYYKDEGTDNRLEMETTIVQEWVVVEKDEEAGSFTAILETEDATWYKFHIEGSYTSDQGAYQGISMDAVADYMLVPGIKKDTYGLIFREDLEFTLTNGKKISQHHNGFLELPPALPLDLMDPTDFDSVFPNLFDQASNIPGYNSVLQTPDHPPLRLSILQESEDTNLILSMADFQNVTPSLEAFFLFGINYVEFFTYRTGNDEYEGGLEPLSESFIDDQTEMYRLEMTGPVQLHNIDFVGMDLPYEAVFQVYSYVTQQSYLYFATEGDLSRISRHARSGIPLTSPRYAFLTQENVVDIAFLSLAVNPELSFDGKMLLMKYGFFQTAELAAEGYVQMARDEGIQASLVYQMSGNQQFAVLPLDMVTANYLWQEFDREGGIPDYSLNMFDHKIYAVELFLVPSQESGRAVAINIDSDHYTGKKKFEERLAYISKEDISKEEFDKFSEILEDPLVGKFIMNESLRDNKYSGSQEFRDMMGVLYAKYNVVKDDEPFRDTRDLVWAEVATQAEMIGVELLEESLAFLDLLIDEDIAMNQFLGGFADASDETQISTLDLFYEEGDDDRIILADILNDSDQFPLFLNGDEIQGITIESLFEILRKKRNDIKDFIEKRQAGSEVDFREMLITQDTVFGVEIRREVYKQFGFSLNPEDFPPPAQEIDDITSPTYRGGQDFSRTAEQLYVSAAREKDTIIKFVEATKNALMVASVFSAVRGLGIKAVARAGLKFGTYKALVLESLVIGVVAGAIFEGIRVAMGDEFDPVRMLIGMGEAFLFSLFFGLVGKLVSSKILQFTINLGGFIGIGIGMYWLKNGKPPLGWDLAVIVYESILTLFLLNVGNRIMDPVWRKISVEYNIYVKDAQFIALQKEYLEIFRGAAKDKNPSEFRAEKMKEYLGRFEKNLEKHEKWLEKNKDRIDKKINDGYKHERAKLDLLKEDLALMKYQEATKISMVSQTSDVFYFEGGQEAKTAFQEKYPDATFTETNQDFIKAETKEGTVVLIPNRIGHNAPKAGEYDPILEEYGWMVRRIDAGVYAVRPKHVELLKESLGDQFAPVGPHSYLGKVPGRNGKTYEVVFVEEATTTLISDALMVEALYPGEGMGHFLRGLSDPAKIGYELYVAEANDQRGTPLTQMSGQKKLVFFRDFLEPLVQKRGFSLDKYFRERAKQEGEEFGEETAKETSREKEPIDEIMTEVSFESGKEVEFSLGGKDVSKQKIVFRGPLERVNKGLLSKRTSERFIELVERLGSKDWKVRKEAIKDLRKGLRLNPANVNPKRIRRIKATEGAIYAPILEAHIASVAKLNAKLRSSMETEPFDLVIAMDRGGTLSALQLKGLQESKARIELIEKVDQKNHEYQRAEFERVINEIAAVKPDANIVFVETYISGSSVKGTVKESVTGLMQRHPGLKIKMVIFRQTLQKNAPKSAMDELMIASKKEKTVPAEKQEFEARMELFKEGRLEILEAEFPIIIGEDVDAQANRKAESKDPIVIFNVKEFQGKNGTEKSVEAIVLKPKGETTTMDIIIELGKGEGNDLLKILE